MARKRPERKNKALLDLILKEYNPETTEDIHSVFKNLTAELIEEMLVAELDEHLDYDYCDKPLGLNTRNGTSGKTLKSSGGEVRIEVPRDRDWSFEPMIVKKGMRTKTWT